MFSVNRLRREMLLAARNRHRKRAADANRALHPDAATVQFDQFLNEGQSNSRAFMCPGGRALDAMKALEHLLALVVGNSHAGVADLQFHGAVHKLQRDRHLALERELESVGEKIQHDLLPHAAIDEDSVRDWLAFHGVLQAGAVHCRAEHAGDVRREAGQIRRLINRLHASGLETREIQERVHELE